MRILVLGDYILDRYVFGTSARLCPEAPVAVVIPQIERSSAGGAGLVLNQLQTLGADVHSWYGSFSEKTRVFSGNHLLCRIDKDATTRGAEPKDEWLRSFDAYVVSDYGKGALTKGLAERILLFGKPCFVDAKNTWDWYGTININSTWLFPNATELTWYAEHPNYAHCFPVIVRKLGAQGCETDGLHLHATVSEVVDTTGAGDIFLAGFVWARSLSLPTDDCLRFANECAGESCRHVGTFVVGKEFAQSVLDRLRASRESQPQAPVSSPGSTLPAPSPSLKFRLIPAAEAIADGIFDIHISNSAQGQLEPEVAPDTPLAAQTLPQSPSAPTESSDTPLPSDLEKVGWLDSELP